MGELFDYVKNAPFEDAEIRHMARQLFSGVKHMKDHGYSHRDLKPENVCLDSDFNLKIIDWGFATPYEPGIMTSSYRGSGSYMAPEIRQNKDYDPHKVDMFSLATTLYVLKMRSYPWSKATQGAGNYQLIVRERPDLFWRAATNGKQNTIDEQF